MSDSTNSEPWSSAVPDQESTQPSFGERFVRVWQAAVGGVVALVIGLGVGIGVDHTLFESNSTSQQPAVGQLGQLGQTGGMPSGAPTGAPTGAPPGQTGSTT